MASLASGLPEGVPAGNPGLLAEPDNSDHCAVESPNLALVYAQAKGWANANLFTPPVRAHPGGSITCDSGDPQFHWRVELLVKQGPNFLPPVTATANIDTMTFTP